MTKAAEITSSNATKSKFSPEYRAKARRCLARILASRASNGGWNEDDPWKLMMCARILSDEMLAWLESENRWANLVKRANKSREAAR